MCDGVEVVLDGVGRCIVGVAGRCWSGVVQRGGNGVGWCRGGARSCRMV